MTRSLVPRPTLWRHLWTWTLVAIALTWVALAGVAYHTGLHEADEISDGQLVATARLWLALDQLPAAHPPPQPGGLKPARHGYEQPQAIMVWQGDDLVVDSHGLAKHWPAHDGPGFETQVVHIDGQTRHWREYTAATTQPIARRVTVVVDLDARNALGRDIALHIARPAFVVLPLVAVLLAWSIRRGLRPLRELSREVGQLDLARHQRLADQHRFDDFASTVTAINALADRLETQLGQERTFAADIAHELRTPLTAISLQAHVVAHAEDARTQYAAAQQVETQALYAGEILSQLLDFARAQRSGADVLEDVNLATLLSEVLAEHAQVALDTAHELSLEVDPSARSPCVPGKRLLLALLVRNLLDNALRHTPPGTQVRVSLQWLDSQLVLAVEDDGMRSAHSPSGTGLGLGLTLVKRIADWHGAQWLSGGATPPWSSRYALQWPADKVKLALTPLG